MQQTMTDIWFDHPRGGKLVVRSGVVAHFDRYRQRRCFSKEAGGQLFATLTQPDLIDINDISGPRPTDKRSFYEYVPDRAAEKVEIAERYNMGLHFVGDWHTHAQDVPRPSGTDSNSMQQMVRLSSHALPGFLLVIVGRDPFPDGLYVSLHTKSGWTRLKPTTPS